MIKQICILTKSYKHGGYCVAGIDMDTKEWIRLVNSEDPNVDEIKKEEMFIDGQAIDCLDIVEYDFIKNVPNSCQTENWLLNKSFQPRFIKSLSFEEIADLIRLEKSKYFLVNTSNLLTVAESKSVKRSLYAFHVQDLKIEAFSYEYDGEIRFRYKCSFNYNGKEYSSISLTDPVYRDILQDGIVLANAIVIASLPCVPYNNEWYYKFVAKIIPIDEQVAIDIKNAAKFADSLKQTADITKQQRLKKEDLPFVVTEKHCEEKIVDSSSVKVEGKDFEDFEILNYLAKSVNPYTGEVITGIDERLQDRLQRLANKMETEWDEREGTLISKSVKKDESNKVERQQIEADSRVGEKWTKEEEMELIKEFQEGRSLNEIAQIHGRKKGGIKSRLNKLGLLNDLE